MAAALSVAAFAQPSVEFPTYTPGENQNGTVGPNYPSTLPDPWSSVMAQSSPLLARWSTSASGPRQGRRTQPLGNGTAAVLQMSAHRQSRSSVWPPPAAPTTWAASPRARSCRPGTTTAIKTAAPKASLYVGRKYLLFSQDQDSIYNSWVSIVNVSTATGLITGNHAQVEVPLDASYLTVAGFPVPVAVLNTVNCTQTVTMPVTGVTMPAPVEPQAALRSPAASRIRG